MGKFLPICGHFANFRGDYFSGVLVEAHGFDHVLATRLNHDEDVAAVLEAASSPDTSWVAVAEVRSFATEVAHGGRRFVVAFSPARYLS